MLAALQLSQLVQLQLFQELWLTWLPAASVKLYVLDIHQVHFVGAQAVQENGQWQVKKAVMSRSARVLMEGWVRVPAETLE